MALNLSNLRSAKGAKKRAKRVGRGHGSGHGTFATRGLKGQRSRSGGKGGLKFKGMKANILNIPKLGGFKSFKPKLEIINLQVLDKNFTDQDIITPDILRAKKLIKNPKLGVKILGMGKISKKLTVKVNKISASAKEAIEKAGGQVVLLKIKEKITKKTAPADAKAK